MPSAKNAGTKTQAVPNLGIDHPGFPTLLSFPLIRGMVHQ